MMPSEITPHTLKLKNLGTKTRDNGPQKSDTDSACYKLIFDSAVVAQLGNNTRYCLDTSLCVWSIN